MRWLLAAGLLLFLALATITIRSSHDAWRSTQERSRSEAVFDLVQVATPTRPSGNPGAVAWLDLQLKRYGRGLEPQQAREYRELVSVSREVVPELLRPWRDALLDVPIVTATPSDLHVLDTDEARRAGLGPNPEEEARLQFRVQRFLVDARGGGPAGAIDPRTLVLTRRRSLDVAMTEAPDQASNLFLRRIVPYLATVAERLASNPGPPQIAGRPLRVVRVYAVSEDGTFVSLPAPDAQPEARGGDLEAKLRYEGQEFRKQPRSPTYVSNEFFFQLDFERPETRYSGLYLDLAGHGLVSTLTASVVGAEGELRAVAAIDLAFDVDWRDFARAIERPQIARLVELEAPPSPLGWRPWSELLGALQSEPSGDSEVAKSGRDLERLVAGLARREVETGEAAEAGSLYHAVVEGQGAIALFQVSQNRWLAVYFPELTTRFPTVATALLAVLGLSLLAGAEINRQRAETAQRKAEAELAEKENLLNSMKVPLTVVDPNTDAVVFGNEAALALGLEPGRRVSDLVAPGRAREHYRRMQHLGRETRRAYGVPMTLKGPEGDDEVRHSVVRSVAVAAPIETLQADQRHRLGIFFPLEPEADLAIFAEELEGRTRDDERRRLAGLLAHGVDTLARVLAHRLDRLGEADPFSRWLVAYLERRLAVTTWLLEHWHAEPPLPPETTCEAPQVRATLERFQQIFAIVRDDAELRSRLHWDNGVLSEPAAGDPFELRFGWRDTHLFTSPVRGGVGLFFEEALVNAMRHGLPGSRPRVEVELDPVRRELLCRIENAVDGTVSRDLDDLEPYGGRRLLERLAALFDWPGLVFERGEGTFTVQWRIRVGERAEPGEVD